MWRCVVVLSLLVLGCVAASAGDGDSRDIEDTVWFQGFLADVDTGTPINGQIQVVARLYDASSGGSSLWGPETHSAVIVTEGWFEVELGASQALPAFDDPPYYLQLSVDGEAMDARQKLASVPSAVAWDGGGVEQDTSFEDGCDLMLHNDTYVTDSGDFVLTDNAGFYWQDDAAYPGYHEWMRFQKDELAFYDDGTWAERLRLRAGANPSYKLFDPSGGELVDLYAMDQGESRLQLNGTYSYDLDTRDSHLRFKNSKGEVTVEINLETGDITCAGELKRFE